MKKKEPQTMEEKVDAMYQFMTGDPLDGKDEGLIGTVRNLKTQVYKIIRWKETTIAWAVGVSFGGGALLAFVITVVTKK